MDISVQCNVLLSSTTKQRLCIILYNVSLQDFPYFHIEHIAKLRDVHFFILLNCRFVSKLKKFCL